jgi:hypothetical protein
MVTQPDGMYRVAYDHGDTLYVGEDHRAAQSVYEDEVARRVVDMTLGNRYGVGSDAITVQARHTPLAISILLDYNRGCDPEGYNLEPQQDTIRGFERDGILAPTYNNIPPQWRLTAKGKAWLATLLETPYPTQQWVRADGRPIEIS